ncbi:Radical SAM protein [Sulfidibacter corallicola]|uniref:Radical SAM protein n=1 Tax=Sulfidibacter corallicola TaxID=2818388 RepID=A0A8A4TL01_SULCO|nr:STM4011 family radical SAM protein [Sulfidibacter corallicola]QTD50220.1 radical SAM protein [Sulfidibacter corallicola]
MKRTILYRGSLSSCNYGCTYCPFAKRRNSRAELEVDAAGLRRFVAWIGGQTGSRHQLLFTPWGEALIRDYYRKAVIALSRMPQVVRVAVQTNLSFPIKTLRGADPRRLALWATYHPGETDRASFLAQCDRMEDLGIPYSVGMVGLHAYLDEIEEMRAALPAHRYLWVNAYKREPNYYTEAMVARLSAVDPYFPINNRRHTSEGRSCRAGHTSFTVDEKGEVRRCHFIPAVVGNIGDGDIAEKLVKSPCTNASCGCYIGYIHLNHLNLESVYGDGLVARIPRSWAV